MVPNCLVFGDSFDRPGGSSPLRGKLFSNGRSNLPASKEAGQGDCDPAAREDVWRRKVLSLRRQLFGLRFLALARVGKGDKF
jgi:hypothetical protein